MKKKIALGLIALVAVVGGVAAMSAYEAHVINVTAHIENALDVHPHEIIFGTVFPQEYVEKQFEINMSESFLAANRVDDIDYVIKQKPKPLDADPDPDVWAKPAECQIVLADVYEARAYCHDSDPLDLDCCYRSLCPYLSKTSTDQNDTSHLSYFIDPDPLISGDEYCEMSRVEAKGRLSKLEKDMLDLWMVDLKVPPFKGYVAQDWPASCPVIDGDPDGEDFGCDLWIEVTNISPTPTP